MRHSWTQPERMLKIVTFNGGILNYILCLLTLVKGPNSGDQNRGKKVPNMASDSTSAEIQGKLRGNYGNEDNAEMMEATYLEQLPVQNDSEIANQKEVIRDDKRNSDNLPMNTPTNLQPVFELISQVRIQIQKMLPASLDVGKG
ncbi:Hypothetical predicted protein [Olea europaea subsp. europaea]|uniref:Uncharacterized protein n=1 Tax=Olea europaea subsp. europaea TaxID=158383 RepID=A0A8S0Q192_OLEEU|nr:Hypothetical predicted protein [Olea europaea subsp. europaea]